MIDRIRTADHYHLRKASAKDVDVTYSWAKEPNVRKYAFQQHEITAEEHQKWFLSKVKDQHCLYYIFEINNEAIGSIRFDMIDSQAVISYLLAPHVQGKGLGLILLKKGMDRLQSDLPNEQVNKFVGDVMMANQGSVRIFEQLGYRKEITEKGVRYTKTLH
jgi:RimJ/RimL family protein N-acetyltransferase